MGSNLYGNGKSGGIVYVRFLKKVFPFTTKDLLNLTLRLRFQLLGGVFVAVILPLLLHLSFFGLQPMSNGQTNSLVVAGLGLIIGHYFFRKLNIYPGLLGGTYIIPLLSIIFAIMLFLLLFLRLDYSRSLLGMSYVFTNMWLFGLYYWTGRVRRKSFAIVPVGRAALLMSIPDVDWVLLPDNGVKSQGLAKNCDAVIVDFNAEMGGKWQNYLASCALMGIPVFDQRHLREGLTGKVRINHISENTLGTLDPNAFYMKCKMVLDRLLAVAVAILLFPVMLIVAALIKLDSPGPALFRQLRVGYRGRPFVCYKFRTMTAGVAEDVRDMAQSLQLAKTMTNDARITKLGRVLRTLRIDELPQILNILKGEMSWIGPRPEAGVLSTWYEKELPFYNYRHVVRPGISGWAQVCQGHVVEVGDVREKLEYDFYYIKNFSPWLDIIILLLTIKTMFTGFGAK